MDENNKEDTNGENTIQELRKSLFDLMKQLKSKNISSDEAKAMTNIAQAIINSAKVEVDFIKAVGGIATGTGFIPLEAKNPNRKALGEKKDE